MDEMKNNGAVTRVEFDLFKGQVQESFKALHEDILAQGRRIEELFRARQLNWPLVLSVIALVGAAAGFGIKNLVETAAVTTNVHNNNAAIDDFRERIKGMESNFRALAIEQESQNKWMSDVHNLQTQMLDREMRAFCTEDRNHKLIFPDMDYWPLNQIGREVHGEGQ
jgi:hypothetical protein